ncbi:hypothetical protein RRG08_061121 [Elysia crispata]|uniref:Uncharacterized protein n=1 Tax=Elysia crispata TaxID=231223 RepID=A0AAE0XDY5_9GAST|nr:hypothetical protein RRG08_061121 [Elysia crispata]
MSLPLSRPPLNKSAPPSAGRRHSMFPTADGAGARGSIGSIGKRVVSLRRAYYNMNADAHASDAMYAESQRAMKSSESSHILSCLYVHLCSYRLISLYIAT